MLVGLELLVEEASGGSADDDSNNPTTFMQPEKDEALLPAELQEESEGIGVESLDSIASSGESGPANPATIIESEADEFGGMRHLWSDGVWRPDGTEPHEEENVMKKNGVQYPIYLTLNPADGKYHVLKDDTDEEKKSKFGTVESVGVVFAFPPLGWQRINIGRQLYDRHRIFRSAIDEVNECTMDLLPQPFVHILYPDPVDEPMYAEAIQQPQYALITLFAVEYALGLMWAAHCPDAKFIKPFAVIGHSLGEFVAAVFSGSISCRTAATLVCERGRLMAERPSCGSMLAVRTSLEAAETAIASSGMVGRVAVACHNGPQSLVLSGDWAALSQLVKKLDLPTRPTRVSATHGDHSPLMAPMVSALDARAALLYSTARPAKPTCHWISTVSGEVMGADEVDDSRHWGKHLTSTVKYVDALKTLYRLCAERQDAPTSRFETGRRVVVVEMGEGMLSRFGDAIASDIIARDPKLRSAKVSFAHTLDRGEMTADAKDYCHKVDARMETVAVPVRKELLCRFLLSPHSTDLEPSASVSFTPASMATESSFVSVSGSNSYACESLQSSNDSLHEAAAPGEEEPAAHRT